MYSKLEKEINTLIIAPFAFYITVRKNEKEIFLLLLLQLSNREKREFIQYQEYQHRSLIKNVSHSSFLSLVI
jgi:hypothetical protein